MGSWRSDCPGPTLLATIVEGGHEFRRLFRGMRIILGGSQVAPGVSTGIPSPAAMATILSS
jgi:hypothetical protein